MSDFTYGSKRTPKKKRADPLFQEEIGRSVLSVTLGQRLKRREGIPVNVKGDRPDPVYSDGY